MAKKGELVVISGYSGVGKGTVIRRLMEEHPEYTFSVSATTRAPRPGEVDGREYFFLKPEEFEAWKAEDRFLETAGYLDKSYGTPRDYVEKKREEGYHVILDIEVQGALQVKKNCADAKLIYILPPSAEELKSRLCGRGTETAQQIRGRMQKAVDETPVIPEYHYAVINDDVDRTAQELHSLIAEGASPRFPREELEEHANGIANDLTEFLKKDAIYGILNNTVSFANAAKDAQSGQ